MEQILIRNLPTGTKSALKERAQRHRRSVEAETRDIIAAALRDTPPTLVDLLSQRDGTDIEFAPGRLGLNARTAEL